MLDAKIASAPNNIQNSYFKKKVNLEEHKAHLEDRRLRERQIAFMIYEYLQAIGTHECVLDFTDLFRISLHADDIPSLKTKLIMLFNENAQLRQGHLKRSPKC